MKQFIRTMTTMIVISVLYMITWKIGAVKHPLWIQVPMILLLAFLPVAGVRLHKAGIEKTECILLIIMMVGMIMRVGYLLYTPCSIRQHDLRKFDLESGGHASYILNIMLKGQLPDSNRLQFYQQPFFYILGSGVSFIITHILHTTEAVDLADAARIVSCVASCLNLYASDALCREFRVGIKGRIISMAFVATSPVFYMIGGSLGPDALCTLFMVLSVLYTMKWYRNSSVKNTILLALIYGFGVMTKVSVAVIAFFTLVVFLYKFVQQIKKKQCIGILGKYVIFGVISLPIGLWFSVRNYIMFGQPLGYVWELEGKYSRFYTGNYSIVQRIFSFSFKNIFSGPYVNVFEDYNAPVYYIKSSLFGEYSYNVPGILSAILLYAAIAMSIITVVAFVWNIRQGKNEHMGNVLIAIILLFYGSVTYFYLRYPYGCSMDYRYMGLLSVLVANVIGIFYENHTWEFFRKKRIVEGVLGLYCLSSVIVYLLVP